MNSDKIRAYLTTHRALLQMLVAESKWGMCACARTLQESAEFTESFVSLHKPFEMPAESAAIQAFRRFYEFQRVYVTKHNVYVRLMLCVVWECRPYWAMFATLCDAVVAQSSDAVGTLVPDAVARMRELETFWIHCVYGDTHHVEDAATVATVRTVYRAYLNQIRQADDALHEFVRDHVHDLSATSSYGRNLRDYNYRKQVHTITTRASDPVQSQKMVEFLDAKPPANHHRGDPHNNARS